MGRTPKEINWDVVEKKMEAGCSAKEIAGGVCDLDTFYKRFKEHYGKNFGDYSDDYYSIGDGLIKFTQYMKAISGNIPMLQLLGRERLGQSKEQEKASPFEDSIAVRHENMLLKAEIERLRGGKHDASEDRNESEAE